MMRDNMISWAVETTDSYRFDRRLYPPDWEYAAVTFTDGIAVVISQNNIGYSQKITAGIWQVCLFTGYAVTCIGTADVPEIQAENIVSTEQLRKICVHVKKLFDEKESDFCKKLNDKASDHAQNVIRNMTSDRKDIL